MVRTRKQRAEGVLSPDAKKKGATESDKAENKPAPVPAATAPKEVVVAGEAPKKAAGGGLRSWLNTSTLATCAAMLYIGVAYTNFSRMLDPLNNLPDDVWARTGRVLPLWPENSSLVVEVAISTLPTLSPDFMRNASAYASTTAVAWIAVTASGSGAGSRRCDAVRSTPA